MTPRGIRNNNPGNLVTGIQWDGLARREDMTPEQQAETRFCVFRLPVWGIRALAKNLHTYHQKHGLRTIAGIMARHAPAHENPTSSYVRTVATALGVEPFTPLRMNYKTVEGLVQAIIQFENGCNPYTWEIPAGIVMAGLEPTAQPGAQRIVYR